MYKIISFDRETGNMKFTFSNSSITKSINVKQYNDYRKVSHMHYVDLQNEDIVLINTNSLLSILVDNDGCKYRSATQFEFDEWMYKTYPNSHNSEVYNYLKN